MVPKMRYGFWIEPELIDGLKTVRERDGILPSEQIRRAIQDWLRKKGVKQKRRTARAS